MTPDPILSLDALRDWIARHQPQWMQDYYAFLGFSSISSEPLHWPAAVRCAEWLAAYLQKLGFEVEMWPSAGLPIVFGSYQGAGPGQPTLLIYHHYDVQPVDPLESWRSPPFQPDLRDGAVYARGAQDNKGQCFYVLQALKLWQECVGALPINVKLCIEGEEEIGSPGLAALLAEKKEALQADYVAVVDVGLPQANRPALTLGIRGIITFDVMVQGAHADLHSGSHGGIAANPIHALVQLLAQLHDEAGRVTVPGFYDEVEALSPEERRQLSWQFDVPAYERQTGAVAKGGERGYTPLERAWIRPTLEINGISGGYAGAGFKTIIPAQAAAKLSCRLVPAQKPEQMARLIADYLVQQAPEGVRVTVQPHIGQGKAVRVPPQARIVKSFSQAFEEVFEAPCEFILEGASIPIAAGLSEVVGGELILLGMGLSSDQIHAPNEHFGVDRLKQGMLVMARSLELLKNP